MTIEIADRLVKLRKKYGYSQEELADKLGLSRQAVSKWERAEASPDTDNLICLAKLYGVSLDELLSTDEDIDTIVKEQIKKEDKKEEEKDKETVEAEDTKEEQEKNKDSVVINNKGIFVKDEDGSTVSIDKHGITVIDSDGEVKKHHERSRGSIILGAIEGALFTIAIVAYVVLGSVLGWWDTAWIVIFIPEIICSFVRCFLKKNANQFNVVFLCCFTFFFVSMFLPRSLGVIDKELWHPMWAVFLLIPVYYSIVEVFNKIAGKDIKDKVKDLGEVDIEDEIDNPEDKVDTNIDVDEEDSRD